MSDKTKFLAFIDLHRQKAEKMKQNITNAQAAKTENGKSGTPVLSTVPMLS